MVKIAFLMLIGQPCATYLPPIFKLNHPDILNIQVIEVVADSLYNECVTVEDFLLIVSRRLSELHNRLKKLVR